MDILGIFSVLIALGGFIIVLSNNISKFSNVVAKLEITVENLEKVVAELKEDNSKSHNRIWKKNEEQDELLNNHESRINILENKEK